jgi:hypothetical protein
MKSGHIGPIFFCSVIETRKLQNCNCMNILRSLSYSLLAFRSIKIKSLSLLTSLALTASLLANSAPTVTVPRAKAALLEVVQSGKWIISAKDVRELRIQDIYSDDMGTHAYFQQQFQGIDVYNAVLAVHINKSGAVYFATSRAVVLPTTEENSVTSGSPISSSHPIQRIATSTLISAALVHETGAPTTENWVDRGIASNNSNFLYQENQGVVQALWISENHGNSKEIVSSPTLIPAFSLTFFDSKTKQWRIWIVNDRAQKISEHSWTVSCELGHQHTNESSSNQCSLEQRVVQEKSVGRRGNDGAAYHAFAFPIESPLYGKADTLINPADDDASPYGWHDVNGASGAEYTTTRGNNVHATEDANDDNQPGYAVNGGSSLQFLSPYNPSEPNPVNYRDFAIVNLFVANNLMHDIAHHYGFNEESGNFQSTNYTNKGLGGDYVRADAQDGSGTNNANFSAPPEGTPVRMQMYIWDGVSYKSVLAGPGGIRFGTGITDGTWGKTITEIPTSGKLMWVNDNLAAKTHQGCTGYSNGDLIKGNIAAIDRGNCTFVQKVFRAQSYGATAVVILDTSAADQTITMATDNTANAAKITIPVLFVKKSDANVLRQMLNDSSFTVSFYDSSAYAKRTDSDLDMGVIAHEYTHGISIRLTCGPSNSNGLNNREQMGEGWSDFIALAFTTQKGDVGSTPRGMGNWLQGEDKNGTGIRTYPYSTNMSINPHTYGNVAKFSVAGQTPVHFTGEIWCSMLWDLYWDFIKEYGFSEDLYRGKGGNNEMIQLVFDAMKLQACGPGFTDARDAILAADEARNGGKNKEMIWKAFARRGLGYSAAQGDPNNCSDGEEAFDMPSMNKTESFSVKSDIKVAISPNPFSNELLVEPSNVSGSLRVEIYSIDGKQLAIPYQSLEGGAVRLNTSALSAGAYILRVFNENGEFQQAATVIKN